VCSPREHVCRLLWRHVAAPEVTLPRGVYAAFPRKLHISIFKQFSRRRVGRNFRRKLPWHNARVVAGTLYGILIQLDLNKLNVSYGRKWRPSSVSAHFLSVSCVSKGRRFVGSKSHSEISPYQQSSLLRMFFLILQRKTGLYYLMYAVYSVYPLQTQVIRKSSSFVCVCVCVLWMMFS